MTSSSSLSTRGELENNGEPQDGSGVEVVSHDVDCVLEVEADCGVLVWLHAHSGQPLGLA